MSHVYRLRAAFFELDESFRTEGVEFGRHLLELAKSLRDGVALNEESTHGNRRRGCRSALASTNCVVTYRLGPPSIEPRG